jgi:hypothetical protein
VPACGGAGEEETLDEVSLAQDNQPTPDTSCTIVKCNGLKDPFGTKECDKQGNCKCVRGDVSGSCDASGQCKEKCSTTTTRPGSGMGIDVSTPGSVDPDDDSAQLEWGGERPIEAAQP